MMGMNVLTGKALLILAAAGATPVGAAPTCDMATPTKINVLPSTDPITYDMSKSVTNIQGEATGTIDPHNFGGVSLTQGFMQGTVSMRPTVKMAYETMPQYNAVCVWYDTIDITMKIKPTIVVAKEVAADQCMKPAVIEHEMKHIKVDRDIVNKYAQIMGQKVHDEIAQRGFVAGPVPIDQSQALIARMQDTVAQIVDLEYRKMDIERTEQQRAVDSLAEYNRVQAICPSFNPLAQATGQRR